MKGRGIAVFFTVLLALLFVGVLGSVAYNMGVSAGLATAAQPAASGQAVVPPYAFGYGPFWHGWGFGIGGLFIGFLFLFLIFGLVRAIFGWGRWRGGYGPGGYGPGGYGPGGYWRGYGPQGFEDWHRELHRREGEGTSAGTSGGPGAGQSMGGSGSQPDRH